ncbi:uncharacterized protein [Asterias amurensis]|uniref:uncharacterized protein n=1 Tax=Asterias amurensis TaxID=7602 RepID=UPI003AB62AA2
MARAPSVWLRYEDRFAGDIIHQSVRIPDDGATLATYYCCMQWNAGMEGGGYCGIQDHPRGKAFIYSIWDPKKSKDPIKAAFTGVGTEPANFGGEGTGLRSLNFSVGWQTGRWYSLVSRRWDHNDHTYFGFWVHNETGNEWDHLITMDFPVNDVTFTSETGSFVEDWQGTGDNKRTAEFRQGFKRKTSNGTWFPFSTAHFSVTQEAATKNHNDNYDAGVKGDCYYLSTGGTISPTPNLGTSKTFNVTTASQPTEAAIEFSIASAKPNLVEWSVPKSSTPQFKYTINLGGQYVASETKQETTSQAIQGGKVGDTVEVVLEDILGNTTSKTAKITG